MSEEIPPPAASETIDSYASHEAIANLIDSVELPILVVARDYAVVNFNPAAAALLSLNSLDFGRPLKSIPMLMEVRNLEELCEHSMSTGTRSRWEVSDGTGSWFSLSIGPYRASDQSIEGAVLTLTNITALRLSLEQAIKERESTKAIINAISEPLIVVDEDFRIQSANQSFYAKFHVSREIMGKVHLYDLGKADWDVSRLRRLLNAPDSAVSETDSLECDHEFPRVGRRTLLLNAQRLSLGAQPTVKLTVVSIQDITERKRAEEAAGRLAAIVDSSLDAVISKDLNGIIRSWNAGAEQIFGYTAAEVVGRSIRVIIPPDRQQEEDAVLASIRRGERVEHFDTIRRRKDGTEVHVSLTVSPVRDDDGQISGASKIARDITDRKAAEEALNQSMALKDHFLSLVSHELKSPLSTVLGNAMLLQKRWDQLQEDQKRQSLADIVSQSRKLDRTIDNLLSLTRLEANGGLELEPVQLNHFVSRVLDAFRGEHPSREVVLRVHDAVPMALGNPDCLEEVLENLLANAVKYSADDTEIEVVVRRSGENEFLIGVLDRGIGISADEREKLFTPFYRSDLARQSTDGMGLGLALSKRIVEAQGGRIEAHLRPGGGSEFHFTLSALE